MLRRSILACLFLVAVGCDDDGGSDAGVDADVDAGAPSCTDGELNQDESDVDCGGVCGATCRVGDDCDGPGDCASAVCRAGVCEAEPSCSDGLQNAMETDTDCGGPACDPCDEGGRCDENEDCASLSCVSGLCRPAICGDGEVNGAETCDEGGGGMGVSTPTCDADCTAPECGDGLVNTAAGETCDVTGETAECDADCTASECGDGVLNMAAGEDCDGDGMGTGGETATCDVDCTTAECGDRVRNLEAGEDCDDGNMDATDRCAACAFTGVDLEVLRDSLFDTTTGELDGVVHPGWDGTAGTLTVANFRVGPLGRLTVTGDVAFTVLAGGDVRIEGTLDASGGNGEDAPACNDNGTAGGPGGPGGFAGGAGGGFTGVSVDGFPGLGPGAGAQGTGDDAGGGGAGHDTPGAAGSADGSGAGGAGGGAYVSFVSLAGGSGGGGGSMDDDNPPGFDATDDGGAGGGGGGGTVVIDALGDVVLTGRISVAGGDGGVSRCGSAAGAGGGGSGGTILLLSPRPIDVRFGEIDVAGGAGLDNGGDGAPGQFYVGPPPSCSDGIQNQDESDVDCGGTVCGGCMILRSCRVDVDCVAGDCVAGFCQAGACGDGTLNGTETDVDCGGVACLPCASGERCMMDRDCVGTCGMGTCVSCDDGTLNQDETDVDCGGSFCDPCTDGQICMVDTDCAGSGCESGACVSCFDGVMNDEETDLDCGGSECRACGGGESCRAGRDCTSGTCTMMSCVGDARSCLEILTRYPTSPSGPYIIQPDAMGTPVTVWCDMTTDGGGWTLVGASLGTALNDQASPYYTDLGEPTATGSNDGLWDGMRTLVTGLSDIRFTCRATAGTGPYTVDLSFYANDMYDSFTTGDDAASCSRTYGATATPAFPGRRDNVSGAVRPEGNTFDCSVDSVGPITEDFCGDTGDFTVDFDDHGMDCNANDGTDWGEDDATPKCGTVGVSGGEWQVWVRE